MRRVELDDIQLRSSSTALRQDQTHFMVSNVCSHMLGFSFSQCIKIGNGSATLRRAEAGLYAFFESQKPQRNSQLSIMSTPVLPHGWQCLSFEQGMIQYGKKPEDQFMSYCDDLETRVRPVKISGPVPVL